LTPLAAADLHISLKAEKIFQLGPLGVTNSMIYGVICAALIAWLMIWAAKRISLRPKKGFSQIIEILIDYVLNLLEGPLGSRAKAVKYAPVFGTFFLFIIFNNLLGLVPLVGPGLSVTVNGEHSPLLRPFTADLNATIAMAVIAIITVQVLSIREQGGKGHLKHYFTDKPLNPINLFIGILEVFGEFTRILSLSLRLFLNTAVGEILVSVFTSMIASGGRTPIAAIPIFLFEMLVAGIQAYVFTVLAATYLGLAISHAHEGHDDDHHSADHNNEVEPMTSVVSEPSK
jgi:F-type H+-transporting ATPase subunit a